MQLHYGKFSIVTCLFTHVICVLKIPYAITCMHREVQFMKKKITFKRHIFINNYAQYYLFIVHWNMTK